MADHHASPGDADADAVQIGPDPRLLLVLVAVLVVGVGWMFLTAGGGDGDEVTLGSIEELARRAEAGPVRLVELPHLVVTRTATRGAAVDQARWGENTGSVLLSSTEQLVVLDTRDPVDDAPLTWCPARGVFEHPDGRRLYAADGLLLAGDGIRGMDRRGFGLTGPALLVVDDGRWVSGIPSRATDTSFAVRGETCVG